MVTTKMNWSGPNAIHFGRKSQCGPDQFILVETKSLWSSLNQFGQTETILDRPKLFWSHRKTRHKFKISESSDQNWCKKFSKNSESATLHTKSCLKNCILQSNLPTSTYLYQVWYKVFSIFLVITDTRVTFTNSVIIFAF